MCTKETPSFPSHVIEGLADHFGNLRWCRSNVIRTSENVNLYSVSFQVTETIEFYEHWKPEAFEEAEVGDRPVNHYCYTFHCIYTSLVILKPLCDFSSHESHSLPLFNFKTQFLN
jgi:hypothetical protein